MRRAQTATEYLVIIVLVIILALTVLSILGGIPGLSGSPSSGINDAKLATANVGVVAYSISDAGATVFLRNNLADTISVDAITIDGEVCTPFTPITLVRGQEIEVFCESILEVVDDEYAVSIAIDYTNKKTTAQYSQDDPEYILANKFVTGDIVVGDVSPVASNESCFGFTAGTITSYDHGTCGLDPVIPSTIGEENVTTIGEYSFEVDPITSVYIPDSVTRIERDSFRNTQLTSVRIGNSVTTINSNAFRNTQLTSVAIPDSVTSMEGFVFLGSYSISELTIGTGLTTLNGYQFDNANLTSVYVPDNILSISTYVFSGNPITNLSLKTGTVIQPSTFPPAGCTVENGCLVWRP